MYNQLCDTPSDINEHLPVLAELSRGCKHITEMGVRSCVSTFAFIEGLDGGRLVSIDINHPSTYVPQNGATNFERVLRECKDKSINFQFIEANTLRIEIEPTDLLFIDTLHEPTQLRQELKLHSGKVAKYIALHDTTSCPDLIPVIDELVEEGVWKIKKVYENNNGLTILERC